MTISCTLRRIPCLSATVTFRIRKVFLTCSSHLFAIVESRPENCFRNWLILFKMQNLITNAGFYSIAVGQRV